MKLAIVCGKSGIKIKSTIVSVKDSLEVDTFLSISDMISSSLQRNYVYDRILVSSGVFRNNTEEVITELKDYLFEYGKETRVVCLVKSSSIKLKESFNSILSSPLYTTMTLDKVTAKALEEAVTLSIADIIKKYEPSKEVKVEVGQEVRDKRELSTLEEGVSTIVKPEEKDTQQKQKKRGFFSKLFGKKDNNVEEDSSELVYQENSSIPREIDWVEELDKKEGTVSNIEGTELVDNSFDIEDKDIDTGVNSIENLDEPQNEERLVKNENLNINEEEAVNNDVMQDGNKNSEFDSLNDNFVDDSIDDFFNDSNSDNIIIDDNQVKEVGNISSSIDNNLTEETENTLTKETKEILDKTDGEVSDELLDDFTLPSEVEDNTVDDSVDSMFIIGKEQSKPELARLPEQVSDDNIDVVVGNEELEFEKRNAKVIEKKIIIKDNASLLKKIESGSRGTIILVTGDRGTGVTTNAINIASHFAKKTDVLYVDADIKNHGLLSYVNYDKILKYDSTQLQGIKLCKSKDLKDMCVIRYANSLDLLTSDYGVETSAKDLAQVQTALIDLSMDYGIVVLDVPFEQLEIFKDIIVPSIPLVCVEGSIRSFMNTMSFLIDSEIPDRYKARIKQAGKFIVTRKENCDIDKIKKYVDNYVEFEGIVWTEMPMYLGKENMTLEDLQKLLS